MSEEREDYGITDEEVEELMEDLNLSFDDAKKILWRMEDSRRHPENLLSIEEFFEKVDLMIEEREEVEDSKGSTSET